MDSGEMTPGMGVELDRTMVNRIIAEEPLTPRERLVAILEAFEAAQGVEIPYPLAKKIAEVVRDLREYVSTIPQMGDFR
jgi:hypothetical protein